jgi:hypothetical protein
VSALGPDQSLVALSTRVAVDIGSTVVKVARVRDDGELVRQEFHPRDFDAGIARQVESILDRLYAQEGYDDVLICSSANGGLRVGIVTLTPLFSGAVLRNQVLLAGANPVFLHGLEDEAGHPQYVDMLIVAGGIDCEDPGPIAARLERFHSDRYRFGALVYAGNRYLAHAFRARFPEATVIPNPLGGGLSGRVTSVFEAVRRAYLDDLVHKEGVSELRTDLARGIRPTPEVVNRGFHRAILNGSTIRVVGACVLLDIGGATTDLHYSVELVRDDSDDKPLPGSSVARYVFTDLGIVASRDSLLLQMRSHPRLYELLEVALGGDTREAYRLLREGEYAPSPKLLSYGCLFLALDRFAQGRGPGLPTSDLSRLGQIILTGGAAQTLDEQVVARIVNLLIRPGGSDPAVQVDRRYQVWVDGITWAADVSA